MALHKFIDKKLATGFICPSHSSHGALVLFIHKKDSSLQLCIDFRGLNQISKMLIHSHSSLISMTHHRKHESIPKSTSSMCIILSECLLETNGRLYSKPIMVHLS